jgi:hypothetical protein
MDERRRRDGGDDGFSWSSEPEPDWVEGIRDARRRRASRLAEALSSPDDRARDLSDTPAKRRAGDAGKEERR